MPIKQIEDLLDEFDFGKVKKVMDLLKWQYHNSPDSEVNIGELRRMARRLLEDVYNESASSRTILSCGGFTATCNMYPGEAIKYLSLRFVITEWSNPAC